MARLTVGTLSTFNHEIQDWPVYKERLEQWFLANDIGAEEDKAGVKRRAILLSNLAESSYKLVRDLALPTQISTLDYDGVVKLLDGHFKPKKCTFAERYRFYSATQNVGEGFAEWTARVRGLATHCGFTALHLDEQLRDRFVLGMEAGPERDKLFTKDLSELTLTKALEMAEGIRSARMGAQETEQRKHTSALQVMKIVARPGAERGRVQQRAAPAASGAGAGAAAKQQLPQCSVCGYSSHAVSECRFARYKCKKCGVQGHLKRMCNKTVNRHHYVECCSDGDDDVIKKEIKIEQTDDEFKTVTVTSTKRGRELLLYKGYRYTKTKVNKNGQLVWRCVNRKYCSSLLFTLDSTVVKEGLHRCQPDEADNEIKKKIKECLQRIRIESTPFRQVYKEAVEEYNRMGFNAMKPMPSFDSVKSTFYHHKRRAIKKTIEYFDNEPEERPDVLTLDDVKREDSDSTTDTSAKNIET